MADCLRKEDIQRLKDLNLIEQAKCLTLDRIKRCTGYDEMKSLIEIEEKNLKKYLRLTDWGDSEMQLAHFYLDGVIDASVMKTFTRATQERIKDLICSTWKTLCTAPSDINNFGCEYRKYTKPDHCTWCDEEQEIKCSEITSEKQLGTYKKIPEPKRDHDSIDYDAGPRGSDRGYAGSANSYYQSHIRSNHGG